MNLIDTHAHLTFEDLENQLDDVLARSIAAGVTRWITVGTDKEHNEKVLRLIGRYDNLWGALGYHPHDAKDVTGEDMDLLKKQLGHARIVAIGECGLDYHYMHSAAETQQHVFRQHLDIAAQVQLPVIIHTREAWDETLAILDEYTGKLKKAVIHCYGGNVEQTKLVVERGYYISFTGTVTFKKSDALRDVAKMIPLDRLMVESDCPFISPHPVRNIRPNEPALITHTAQRLANIHGLPLEQFAEKITQTSENFFEVDKST